MVGIERGTVDDPRLTKPRPNPERKRRAKTPRWRLGFGQGVTTLIGGLFIGGYTLYNAPVPNAGALQFAVELARIAHDHKSENVIALDLRGINAVTDFTVIGTGTSERQLRAVAEHVIEYGKKLGQRPYGYCGFENAAWIIVDYVDVVFHVFAKPYREYYDLELLWGDVPRIEWARSETA